MAVEIRIPELGESVADGVIARWLKREGDLVRVDEPVLELETDKATVEIPAPAAGRLEIVEREGVTVRVGTVVARIAEGSEAPASSPRPERPAEGKPDRPEAPPARPRPAAPPARTKAPDERAPEPAAAGAADERPSDPAATAADEKVPDPVAARAAARVEAPPDEQEEEAPPAPRRSEESDEGERKPMSRLRRRVAERLVEAQRTAAILTTFNEVDLSRLLAARRRHRERFRARHGVDLGLVSLFGRACLLALADVPILNARIDGDDIVHHRRVNLGIAVSTKRGLVVPVVREADRLSLAELERAIEHLAGLAREGRLTPDHLAHGTFTITNGGVFGSLLSTPILNPPQSGILGMHKIEDRPVAVDGQVVIRPMMYVALSYDHRLVDGEQAVTFLVRVKERLEDPVQMLLDA
jgi:2-oxoglutarate dehydrogenase E2 component (dihydrolipoamide succinyltransferase)